MPDDECPDSTSSCIDPELFEPLSVILSDDRCRHVLSVLRADDGPYTVDRLAAAVAAEMEGQTEEPPRNARERVRALLHHWHLPKLADSGLVEYDLEDGRATLTGSGVRCANALGLSPSR